MSPLPSPPRQPWGACGFKYGTGECVVLFIHQEKGALVLVLNPLGRVWVAATTKGAFGSHHTTKGVCFVVYITEYGAWVSGQPRKGCVGLTESPKRVRLVFVAPAGSALQHESSLYRAPSTKNNYSDPWKGLRLWVNKHESEITLHFMLFRVLWMEMAVDDDVVDVVNLLNLLHLFFISVVV
ncbi:hypothetical protein Tco_0809170 [Tanacetum coccineum]